MKTFLHIDDGRSNKSDIKGFKNEDWNEMKFNIDENSSAKNKGTLLDMSQFNSKSVDAIYSCKNIEHVYPHQVELVLGEFLRVLKDDGFAVIQCYDLQSVCEYVNKDKLLNSLYESDTADITPMDILYGSRKDLEDGNHSRLHKCGFTYSALIGAFHQAGFKKWIGGRRPRKFDLYLIACKNKHSDNELNNLAYQFLP